MSKIAIIGASYLQLPAVQKAKEMGHEAICFAWPDGAVCKDYADKFYPISITDKEDRMKAKHFVFKSLRLELNRIVMISRGQK